VSPSLRLENFPRQFCSALRRSDFSFSLLALASSVAILAVAGCSHPKYSPPPPGQTPQSQQTPAPTPGSRTPPGQLPPSSPSGPPPAIEHQPAIPGVYTEEGVASWYGIPFNGHRTSNGEIYDMHQMTAAHRTLPFGAVVRVTNLNNGMQTQVRINDRGPFVANRVIDLSQAAAQAIQMIGTGTARVRLEILAGPNPSVGYFAVQVGAFRVEENAEKLKAQLAERYSAASVVEYDSPSGMFYRVRVGRFTTEDAALQLASQLHSAEQMTTFVVRLDE
jgi:rare lipoprotein A